MADSLTKPTSSLPAGASAVPGLGMLTGTLQGGLSNLLNTGGGMLDKYFPPEKREALKSKLSKFATEKPYLASFLLSQLALSGPAIALFVIMSITVLVFALIAGILIGLVGALLFIVFAVGVALIFLLPTLFFTTFAAVFIWLWGMGAYMIVKWFNKKDVPGVHVPLADGVRKQTGLDGLLPLGSDGKGQQADGMAKANGDGPEKPVRKAGKPAGQQQNHSTETNGDEHGDDKENKPPSNKSHSPVTKKVSSVGKSTGVEKHVGDVKKNVGGVTGQLGVQI